MVSIIVPTYNLEQYINSCLDSLIHQSYTDIEIIVVDDGSTDDTAKAVLSKVKIDKRIKLFIQDNGGAARARNKGLDLASGEYICFVDGDDMLSYNTIEDNVLILEEDKTIDWVAFSIIRTDTKGHPITIPGTYGNLLFTESRTILKDEFVPAFYNKTLSGVCCGAIYRKSSIKNIRFPEGEYYEDGFFFTDLLSFTSKGYLSDKGRYLYVHRPNSSQLQKLDQAHLKSDVACSTKRLKQYRDIFPQYEEIYKAWENNLYYYYKNEYAKGTEGAREIFMLYKSSMDRRVPLDIKKEFKFLLYRIFGYKRIIKTFRASLT